jgi:hypothetical protein
MKNLLTREIDSSRLAAFTTELETAMNRVAKRSGGDFESSALTLVQWRNSRFTHMSHFIALP